MIGTQRGESNWRNVPIPEPHVMGILVGIALHVLAPWPITDDDRLRRAVGWPLIGSSLSILLWAVRAVGDEDIERPSSLVTTGPYALSRNPMYVAWTVLYAGIALVVNTVWLVLLLPVVVGASHRTVLREERTLERAFGEAYEAHRRDVRRYV